MGEWLEVLAPFAPLLAVLAGGIVVLLLAERLLSRAKGATGGRLVRQAVAAAGTVLIALLALIAVPMDEERRTQVLGLVGVVASATIGLASTSFLGNAFAGIFLRLVVRSFEVGDFVEVDGRFGRVSETGLFHTELQTEERALTTLPNLFLVTNAVTVVRSSGAIVAATVSLGYDVPRTDVEAALLRAAERAKLESPFVQVVELGDFSVQYRCAGLLRDVVHLISARGALRAEMMDALHEARIEIVSPNYLSARVLSEGTRVLPPQRRKRPVQAGASPEAIVFDKAERAAEVEKARTHVESLERSIEETSDPDVRAKLEAELATARTALEALEPEEEEEQAEEARRAAQEAQAAAEKRAKRQKGEKKSTEE